MSIFDSLLIHPHYSFLPLPAAVVFSLSILFIGLVIFFENNNPTKTLAWMIVLMFAPLVGFIFYIFFGNRFWQKIKYRKRKLATERALTGTYPSSEEDGKVEQYIEEHYPEKKTILYMNNNIARFNELGDSPFTLDNKVEIFNHGSSFFPDLVESIRSAKKHIHIEFYIFRSDDTGKMIQEELIRKAAEGVKIRILMDGFGCFQTQKDFIKKFKDNGIDVHIFSPVRFRLFNNTINFRNHRKITVIDGVIGYTGGFNIGDEYTGPSENYPDWRDTHIRIEGAGVKYLQNTFIHDWYYVTRQRIGAPGLYPTAFPTEGSELIQVTSSGPNSAWKPIMKMYFEMIATATKNIYLVTPYFIPGEDILEALKNAALSGIDVRVIIPGIPDKRFVKWAGFSYVEDMLAAGVRVYEYQKGFVHSKTLTVDGIISTVGSANLDLRSFTQDFEINAFIYGKNTAAALERDFMEDLSFSTEIIYTEHLKRPLRQKFLESFARLFSPLL